MKNKYKF